MNILVMAGISFCAGVVVGYVGLRKLHVSDKTWATIGDNMIYAVDAFASNEPEAGKLLKSFIKSNIRESGLLKTFDNILVRKGLKVDTPGK